MLEIVDNTVIIDQRPEMTIETYSNGDIYVGKLLKILGDTYGSEQFAKLEEEMKEALAEVQKVVTLDETTSLDGTSEYNRHKEIAEALYRFIEEMADVCIVLHTILNSEQFSHLVPLFEAFYNFKLERQAYRLTVGVEDVGKEKNDARAE